MIIVGAGIAGLSLSYFLSQKGIKHEIIERSYIGNKRDTSLVSENIKKFFEIEEFIIEEYNKANFFYNNDFTFSINSKKKMLLIDREMLEKYIFKNIDKKFAKFNFNENVIRVDLEKNKIVTDKRRINFDILIDASGNNFLIGKNFSNQKYVNAYECIVRKEVKKGVNIFFDKNFSKNFFGWIVGSKKFSKIGIMDFNLKRDLAISFFKKFKIKPDHLYGNLINVSIPKKIVGENFAIVGEACGLVKNFSLGGINFAIISSFLLSKYIDNLKKYEKAIKKVFGGAIMRGKIVRVILKNINIKYFKFLVPFIKNIDPDFLV
jgi:flavin-dependent dehydrogenase